MDKRKVRYLLAVYLFLTAIAIVFALVGVNYSQDPLQSLVLNLSTEILGAVLVFFVINRLFLIEDWEMSERLNELADRLEQRSSFLFGREFRESEKIEQVLKDSSKISLLGYSLVRFIRMFRDTLTEQVFKGAQLRIVVIDPESKAAELIRENLATSEFQRDIETSLEYIKHIIEQGQERGKGRVEVRSINWIPSCAMIIIDPDKPTGYLSVGIYPPYYELSPQDRAKFKLTPLGDERWYKKYCAQYEQLWHQAQPVDLD